MKKIEAFLLTLLFLVFSLGQLTRISFIGQQVNGYLYEFIMLLVLVICFAREKIGPLKEAYKKNKTLFWFFAWTFFTYGLEYAKYHPVENLVGLLYQLRLIFYFIFFIYVKNKIPKLAINSFLVMTVVIAFLQYFLYPDLRNLLYAGWDPHLYRVFGVYFDTYIAVSVFGLCFFYLLFQKRTILNQTLLVLYFILLIMTFSRIGYLAFTIALFFIYMKDLKKFLLLFSMVLLVVFLLPKPQGEGVNLGRIFSIESRLNDYKVAASVWQKSPIIGIGYNRIRYFKQDYLSHSGASFHSSFMIILATTGIVGLMLFLSAILNLGKVNNYAVYPIIFICLVSLGDNALLHPLILFPLLSFISFSRRLS